MQDAGRGKPSSDEALHPLPGEPVALAAAPKRLEPEPSDLAVEAADGPTVAGHGVLGEMSPHDARQPPPLVGDGQMPTSHKLVFDLLELYPQPLGDGVAP
jgi:hypothetical protein